MSDDGSGIRRVAGLYSAEEGQEGGRVLGYTVVRPRRELELTDLALLTGAVLEKKQNKRIKDKEWYKSQAQCNAESFLGDYNISGLAIKFDEPNISRTIKDLRHEKSHFGCLHAEQEVWQRGALGEK